MTFVQDFRNFADSQPAVPSSASKKPSDFVFRSSHRAPPEQASSATPAVEEIALFSVEAGDELDMTEIAVHFGLTPGETMAAMQFTQEADATLVSLVVKGQTYDLVRLHGVTPAILDIAKPWVFDTSGHDVLETFGRPVDATDDTPLEPLILSQPLCVETPYQNQASVTETAEQKTPIDALGDAFVFEKALTPQAPRPSQPPKRADLAEIASALGVSQADVLDAVQMQLQGDESDRQAVVQNLTAALSRRDAMVI